MLRGLRPASARWLGRIVVVTMIAALAACSATSDNGAVSRGSGGPTLAKIGDADIGIDLFRQTFNDQIRALGRRVGHPITPQQVNALGLDRQVLAEMIAEAGLDQLAGRMQLRLSDDAIVQRIASDPAFQAPEGGFDRVRFEQILRQAGYTEERFIDAQRSAMLRRQIIGSMTGGLLVPTAWLAAVNEFQNQERSIAYLVLGPPQAGDIPQPTAEELNKYFDERKILFRAPEYRKVVIVTAMPAELAKTIEVSDEDVRRAYEQDIGHYTTPQRRHVEEIVFHDMAEAQAASARLKSGLTFAALAAERGLKEKDIDLGTVPKSGILDPAVADAAFSLKEGEVSAPVQGRFGTVIVTVLKIEPDETKPLDAVAPSLRRDLALERAKTEARNIHDKLEDERASGDTLEQAAQKLNLPVVTYNALDRSGRDPAGKLISGLPDANEVMRVVFSSDVGADNPPIGAGGGYVWYGVAAITPPRDRTFDEAGSRVEEYWRDDQVASRLKAKAADLLDKLRNGDTLEALAAANGIKVQTAVGLKRGGGAGARKVVESAFHSAANAFGSAEGDKPTEWIVFRVTDVQTPTLDPRSIPAKGVDQLLRGQLSDDILNEYAAWLENSLGVTINQEMLAQAMDNGAPDSH